MHVFGICALARSRHVGGCALIWTRGRAGLRLPVRPSVCDARRGLPLSLWRRRTSTSSAGTSTQRPQPPAGGPTWSWESREPARSRGVTRFSPTRHGRPTGVGSPGRPLVARFACAAYHTAAILPRFRRFSQARLLCFRRHVRRSTPRRAVLAAPANETPLQVRRRGHRQPGVADR
jgi:hypothetical protein